MKEKKDISLHDLQDDILASIYYGARERSCFKLQPSTHCLLSAKKALPVPEHKIRKQTPSRHIECNKK